MMRGLLQILHRKLSERRVFALAVAGLCLAALALRLAWIMSGGHLAPVNSESFFVSRAFAETGVLADAYRPGSGPTAHVSPVMPLLAGSVYRLLGVGSPAAELALIAIAMTFVGISLFAVDRAMKLLSSPPEARLGALAFTLLAPMNFSNEMQAFRVWEGALAAAALAVVLALVLQKDQEAARPGWRLFLVLAVLIGMLAQASPPAALAAYGCIGLLALRRRGIASFVGVAALCAVALVAVSYPWAVRNEAIFGEKVWSRTNFGFNFALGFYDGAVDPADPRKAFLDRLEEIDPYSSDEAYGALVAAGGEAGYSKVWSARTREWIAAHPGESARIAVRHLVEFYFPPQWNWAVYTDAAKAVAARQAVVWLISLVALIAVAWRLLRADWRYLYVLASLSLPAVPYVLAQPILRYRYVVTTLIVYLAADAAWRTFAWLADRSPRADRIEAVS